MENILLFISNKYIESIESIKDLTKSGNNISIHNYSTIKPVAWIFLL